MMISNMKESEPSVWDVIAQAIEQIEENKMYAESAWITKKDYLAIKGWKRIPRKIKKRMQSYD